MRRRNFKRQAEQAPEPRQARTPFKTDTVKGLADRILPFIKNHQRYDDEDRVKGHVESQILSQRHNLGLYTNIPLNELRPKVVQEVANRIITERGVTVGPRTKHGKPLSLTATADTEQNEKQKEEAETGEDTANKGSGMATHRSHAATTVQQFATTRDSGHRDVPRAGVAQKAPDTTAIDESIARLWPSHLPSIDWAHTTPAITEPDYAAASPFPAFTRNNITPSTRNANAFGIGPQPPNRFPFAHDEPRMDKDEEHANKDRTNNSQSNEKTAGNDMSTMRKRANETPEAPKNVYSQNAKRLKTQSAGNPLPISRTPEQPEQVSTVINKAAPTTDMESPINSSPLDAESVAGDTDDEDKTQEPNGVLPFCGLQSTGKLKVTIQGHTYQSIPEDQTFECVHLVRSNQHADNGAEARRARTLTAASTHLTVEEAQQLCQDWNILHNLRPLFVWMNIIQDSGEGLAVTCGHNLNCQTKIILLSEKSWFKIKQHVNSHWEIDRKDGEIHVCGTKGCLKVFGTKEAATTHHEQCVPLREPSQEL